MFSFSWAAFSYFTSISLVTGRGLLGLSEKSTRPPFAEYETFPAWMVEFFAFCVVVQNPYFIFKDMYKYIHIFFAVLTIF